MANDDPGFVEIQRAVNFRHSNGAIEATKEEAVEDAHKLLGWIEWSGLGGGSFLDAGCRTGYAMEAFIERRPYAKVVGLDIVPEFVEMANQRSDAVVGDLQEMPFTDEEFDWTFSVAAIEHCPDAGKAAREIQRVSRMGCYVITDIEDVAAFEANPSHNTRHDDVMEWCDLFRHPDWQLVSLYVPNHKRVEMLWVRKKWLVRWKEDSGRWRL